MLLGTGYQKDLTSHHAILIAMLPLSTSTNLNSVIKYNVISNIGYNGISAYGKNFTINNNLVHHFCMQKDDGGGIYSWNEEEVESQNINILNNIVMYGMGYLGGRPYTNRMSVQGIYSDNFYSAGITVSGNTIAHMASVGYFSQSNRNGTITNNIFYDCGDAGILLDEVNGSDHDNLVMSNNIFVNKSPYAYTFIFSYIGYSSHDLSATVDFDHNYYCEPIANGNYFLHWVQPADAVYETLAQWQISTGQDANSYFNLAGTVADTSLIDFYYNATLINKVVNLGTPMRDMKNVLYPTSITLLPFTSTVLIPD